MSGGNLAQLRILEALDGKRRTGFQIGEAADMAVGTVYPVLRRMEAEGLITSEWHEPAMKWSANRPRYYALTDEGRHRLHVWREPYRRPA